MRRRLLVWLVLNCAVFAVLLAWITPDAIQHRAQLHTVSTEVLLCAGEHSSAGRAEILHLADCAGDNPELRHKLATLTTTWHRTHRL